MECNKDEAIRAKDIAVRKFEADDFNGAKKFALKAQALYPELEGISQMITTLDVHISANNRIGEEKDYYGILHVNPLADDEIIKKQYRKLVLQLHPDKNKSVGAEAAFLLAQEAFNVLSDKMKRSAHNTKRHIRMAQRVPVPQPQPAPGRPVDLKVPAGGFTANPASNVPDPANGDRWYLKRPGATTSSKKPKKHKTQNAAPVPQPIVPDCDSFWTVCNGCKMQYEYQRSYLNQYLQCPKCHVGFHAREIPAPSNMAPLRTQVSGKVHPSKKGTSARWTPLTREGWFGKQTC